MTKAILTCIPLVHSFSRDTKMNISYTTICEGEEHCRRGCASYQLGQTIDKLADSFKYVGLTDCASTCSEANCGCYRQGAGWLDPVGVYVNEGSTGSLQGNSCLFVRKTAIPTDKKLYQLFTCSAWQSVARVNIRTQIQDRVTEHKLDMTKEVMATIPSMQITMHDFNPSPLPLLSSFFLSSSEGVRMLSANQLPSVRCPDINSTLALNEKCTLEDTCDCKRSTYKVSCKCDDNSLNLAMADSQQRFP